MSPAEGGTRTGTGSGTGASALLGIMGVAILLALAVQQAFSATPPREAAPLAAGVEVQRSLSGTILYRSSELVLPAALAVAGDRLVVGDSYADHALRVIHRSDGTLERAFGRKGRGPREFETVVAIDVLDASGRLMVYDPTLQRVTWIDLDVDFERERWVADRSVPLSAPAMVLSTVWAPGGLVGVGAFRDGRLAHLTADGRLIRTSGPLPVAPAGVAPDVWTRTYQSRLKASPNRVRFAVVSRFADRLEIYGQDGTLLATGDRPYGFDPQDLRTEDPGAVRFGYLDLAVTDARIYALFSGRLREDGGAYLGDRVHVFSWEGRLLEIWALDVRLMAIAVAPGGDQLYGIRHEPDPAVVAFTVGTRTSLAQAR